MTLGEIADLAAERHGWPSVHVEAKVLGPFQADLVAGIRGAGRLIAGADAPGRRSRIRVTGGKVEARAFGVGGEVQFDKEPSGEATPSFGEALAATIETATAHSTGLVLTVDELQNADPGDISMLFGVIQEQVPQGWPLVLALAALPTLRETRGRRRLPTYLESA